ncbi:MAG: hypothetical protein Kow00121_04610 [Elainellaceae cyanobacterium]
MNNSDRKHKQALYAGLERKHILRVFWFSCCLFAIYGAVFLLQEQLQGPLFADEKSFWKTSLLFSHSLLPDLNQLKNYPELNTPLPFIIFGNLEYLFSQGIFAGRLLNLILSLIMVFLIGVPLHRNSKHSVLSAIGLLSFPYYLWLSSLLYTDIVAAFFVFFGFWFYLRNQHLLSGIAFVLAIASRQYMLTFPVALIAYEIANSLMSGRFQFRLQWLTPAIAASSIFVWFRFFNGIAPQSGIVERATTPAVQQTLWAIAPDSSLYFLACLGLYFVIPEWLLFCRKINPKFLLIRKNYFIASGLLALFLIFPPIEAHGLLIKVTDFLPASVFSMALFYCLALLVCLRFSKINLAFFVLLVCAGLMMKAYPWDKYALPLLVVFWYFKSIDVLDGINQSQTPA